MLPVPVVDVSRANWEFRELNPILYIDWALATDIPHKLADAGAARSLPPLYEAQTVDVEVAGGEAVES